MSETPVTTTDVFAWEEPPPAGTAGRPEKLLTDDIRALLQKKPGAWGKISDDSRAGTVARAKARHPNFEFTTRKIEGQPSNHVKVWARYVAPVPQNAGD